MALALSVREAGPKLNLGLTASGFFSPTTLFPLGTQIVKTIYKQVCSTWLFGTHQQCLPDLLASPSIDLGCGHM